MENFKVHYKYNIFYYYYFVIIIIIIIKKANSITV